MVQSTSLKSFPPAEDLPEAEKAFNGLNEAYWPF
jgi:hypothetical protein